MDDIKIKPKEQPEIKLNRAGRRKKDKAIHHNIFTKKYKSLRAREAAWEIFLGPQRYAAEQKYLRRVYKEYKAKKQEERLRKSGVVVNAKTI